MQMKIKLYSFEEACELAANNPEIAYQVGYTFLNGGYISQFFYEKYIFNNARQSSYYTTKSTTSAHHYFKLSAEGGCAKGQYYYANILAKGIKGVEKNPTLAVFYYISSALKNNVEAEKQLRHEYPQYHNMFFSSSSFGKTFFSDSNNNQDKINKFKLFVALLDVTNYFIKNADSFKQTKRNKEDGIDKSKRLKDFAFLLELIGKRNFTFQEINSYSKEIEKLFYAKKHKLGFVSVYGSAHYYEARTVFLKLALTTQDDSLVSETVNMFNANLPNINKDIAAEIYREQLTLTTTVKSEDHAALITWAAEHVSGMSSKITLDDNFEYISKNNNDNNSDKNSDISISEEKLKPEPADLSKVVTAMGKHGQFPSVSTEGNSENGNEFNQVVTNTMATDAPGSAYEKQNSL